MTYRIILQYISKILRADGNKEVSQKILSNSFLIIKKNCKVEPKIFLKFCLDKSRPFCEIKSLKISGINYKVPGEINLKRQKALICKWIVQNASSKISIEEKLANELLDTFNLVSKTIKMCEDTHKTAEANKIYIEFTN